MITKWTYILKDKPKLLERGGLAKLIVILTDVQATLYFFNWKSSKFIIQTKLISSQR